MSVKTRSQLKSTMNFQPVKQDLVVWFKKMIINYSNGIDALSNKLKYMTNGIDYKKILYDRMRLITEVYYNVHQYLPELYESSIKKDKLYKCIKSTYDRIQNYYDENQRNLINYSPLDNIEFNIIKTTYEQLYETEKMCIQYLEPKDILRRPRRCPYKNYIGMEIEQYDYITDYWNEINADTDTDTDSDYDPKNVEDYEEDEKDDEEYEKYVVTEDEEDEEYEDEYEEDEDEDDEYIDKKEDKRILRKDKKAENEIYKVIHQSNKNKNKNDNIVRVRYIKNLCGTKQITVTKFNGADNIHSGCFPYTSTHIRFID
jgi:hypothetical protein